MTTFPELQRAVQKNRRLITSIPDIAPGVPGGDHIPETTYGENPPNSIVGVDGDIYLQQSIDGLILKTYQKLGGAWIDIGEFQESPWISYSPTISSETGTITTASSSSRYKFIGKKTIHLESVITITTNGTGGGAVYLPLPINSTATLRVIPGIRNNSGAYRSLFGYVLFSIVAIYNYDGTYPGADGVLVSVIGDYEIP